MSEVASGQGEVLVLMSDYFSPTCIWVGGRGCLSRDGLARLSLTEPLVGRLLAWQELFDQSFSHEDRWKSAEARDAYERSGRQLLRELQAALPQREVKLDLWPVTGTAPTV